MRLDQIGYHRMNAGSILAGWSSESFRRSVDAGFHRLFLSGNKTSGVRNEVIIKVRKTLRVCFNSLGMHEGKLIKCDFILGFMILEIYR